MQTDSPSTPWNEQVTTTRRFLASPSAVWQCLMFYEDVPRRPWPLLRLLLPQPLRSEGDKLCTGGEVRCTYESGELRKRITEVAPARLLRFEVTEQALGIERYGRAHHGSYELLPEPTGGTRLLLTTAYRGFMRPRFLWRLIERYVCHSLHHHILGGMHARLGAELPGAPAVTPRGEAETVEAPSR